jgi:4-amino-4-deoxy-L-arabinose transferase-like glycosyltransferase
MPSGPSLAENSERVWLYRALAFFLIAGISLFRLYYLIHNCPLDLAPDEAHYWHWSLRLDWSYYSKGPLIALLIRLSCWLLGGWSENLVGSQMVAVRIPALACGALLLVSLYALTALFLRKEKWALLVVVLALTLPIIAAGSLLMTIDAPYTCCWGWGLVFVYRALFRASRWSWLGAGLCVALGILAKYTMILFVPMVGLFLLATPAERGRLLQPGFWVLTLVGALGGLPILYWNINNDWISFQHMTNSHIQTKNDQAASIQWLGPLAYLGTQCALFLVYWFVAWACAMVAHNPRREQRPEYRYLWFMSVPMFVFFWVFSLKNGGGEPNWPITAYLSGMALASAWFIEQLSSPTPWVRRTTRILLPTTALLGLAATMIIHWPTLVQPVLVSLAGAPRSDSPMPLRRLDPTCRLRGWRAMAAEVDRVCAELRAEGIEPVVVGGGWTLPGEIAFYCQGHPEVYSVGRGVGDRHSQYDLWRPNPVEEPGPFKNKTFLMVGARQEFVENAFDHVEKTREFFYVEAGQPIASWNFTICRGFRGFPPKEYPNQNKF